MTTNPNGPLKWAPRPQHLVLQCAIPRDMLLSANEKKHWARAAPVAKELRELGLITGRAASVKSRRLKHAWIFVEACTPPSSHFDAANLHPTVKPLLDGLIDAGLLPDDSDKYLRGPFIIPGPDTRMPGRCEFVFQVFPANTLPESGADFVEQMLARQGLI